MAGVRWCVRATEWLLHTCTDTYPPPTSQKHTRHSEHTHDTRDTAHTPSTQPMGPQITSICFAAWIFQHLHGCKHDVFLQLSGWYSRDMSPAAVTHKRRSVASRACHVDRGNGAHDAVLELGHIDEGLREDLRRYMRPPREVGAYQQCLRNAPALGESPSAI